MRLAGALGVLIAAALTAWMLAAFGISLDDNNDGSRVLDKAMVDRVHVSANRPVEPAYPMLPTGDLKLVRLVPDSLSGLIALTIAGLSRLAGEAQFWTGLLSLAYAGIFLAGVALLWGRLRHPAARAVLGAATAVFLLCPLGAGYFRSLFEEAALIAVFPLWVWAALRAARGPEGLVWLAGATVALVYAKSAAVLFLLPFAVLLARQGMLRHGWLALPVLAAVLLSLAASQLRHGEINAVNRVLNGLAWSVSDVSDWPERDHAARMVAARDRVDRDQFVRTGLPEAMRPVWGGAFWPDVRDLPPQARADMASHGRLPSYAAILARDPGLFAAVAVQSWTTALRADFRLHYLYPHPLSPPVAFVLERLGWLLVGVAALAAIALLRGQGAAAALLAPVLLAPAFVVVGDGYFELEKHLMPFLLFVPFAAAAILDLLLEPRPMPGRRAA